MAKWMMNIQLIDPDKPESAEERWLVLTVHRLAREAGLETMPEIGVFNSPEPNAFATGPTRNSALVAVSTGLFKAMQKDDIEGVLGHEITHVTNGDMVTMTLLQGVINAFVMFLARFIAILLSQGSREGGRGGGASYFMVMMLQTVLGFLGMIPLMAFSRWREFRADAGGAHLAGRTKMISALQALLKFKNMPVPVRASSLSAFMISSKGGSLFSSHPPLEERIERLRNASSL
jgi:heat shock protein HtpX